jgi:hypothetical protein
VRFASILTFLLLSCSASVPDVRVSEALWDKDTIALRFQTSAGTPITAFQARVECTSCKLADPRSEITSYAEGWGRLYISEAPNLVSARLRLSSGGWDTNIVVTQRSGVEAVRRFGLQQPLLGRVLVERYAVLYADSTQETVADQASPGDELNLFSESGVFYLVHHPLYGHPLYLLKSNGRRMF